MYKHDVEMRDSWVWPKDDIGAWMWLNNEMDLPQRIRKHVSNFDTCIHAGAHAGIYTKQYAYMFRHIYAVEPQGRNFFCLTTNVHEENVTKIQACFSNKRKRVNMYTADRTNSGGFFVTPGDDFHVILMDDLIGDVGLIHLDVEGHELEALQGGKELIDRCSPVIVLETIHPEKDKVAAEFLFELGYEVVELLGIDDWGKPGLDTVYKRKPKSKRNKK
jgi:FkbM family methyltransferase